jgi:hypothetical protein
VHALRAPAPTLSFLPPSSVPAVRLRRRHPVARPTARLASARAVFSRRLHASFRIAAACSLTSAPLADRAIPRRFRLTSQTMRRSELSRHA